MKSPRFLRASSSAGRVSERKVRSCKPGAVLSQGCGCESTAYPTSPELEIFRRVQLFLHAEMEALKRQLASSRWRLQAQALQARNLQLLHDITREMERNAALVLISAFCFRDFCFAL